MTPFLNTRIELNENVRNSISVTSCGHLVTSLGSITMSVSCVDWFLVEEEPIRHHRIRTLANAIINWTQIPVELQDAFCMDGTRSQGYSTIDKKMFFWKIFWFEDETLEEICEVKQGAYPVLSIFSPSEKPLI